MSSCTPQEIRRWQAFCSVSWTHLAESASAPVFFFSCGRFLMAWCRQFLPISREKQGQGSELVHSCTDILLMWYWEIIHQSLFLLWLSGQLVIGRVQAGNATGFLLLHTRNVLMKIRGLSEELWALENQLEREQSQELSIYQNNGYR